MRLVIHFVHFVAIFELLVLKELIMYYRNVLALEFNGVDLGCSIILALSNVVHQQLYVPS